jgi:ADP-ribosylation factor protein 1
VQPAVLWAQPLRSSAGHLLVVSKMSHFLKYLSSTFQYVLEGRTEPKRVLVLGLDAAGKTTFLHKHRAMGSSLLQPEIETTIPTIGFNVETAETKKYSMTCWDVGGCDKIRPLWRHFMQNCGGIIFIVDSNDRDRVPEAKNELQLFLSEEFLVGLPVLIAANKCDLPNSMRLPEVIERFDLRSITGRSCRILGTCMTLGDGVAQVNAWLMRASKGDRLLDTTDANVPPVVFAVNFAAPPGQRNDTAQAFANSLFDAGAVGAATAMHSAKRDAERAQRTLVAQEWTTRVDCPEDEFLSLLSSYQLDIWDHYTHVRIAWVLLHRHGIQEGFSKIAQVLQDYIANSTRTDGKSFHPTMTRFWCHMIAYSMHLLSWDSPAPAEMHPDSGFKLFITALCTSDDSLPLWDKMLFKEYYSSAVMFGAAARAGVSQPDLQGLPNIVEILNPALVANAQSELHFLQQERYWRKSTAAT